MVSFFRERGRKAAALAAAVVFIFTLLPRIAVSAQQPYEPKGVNVAYRTAQEIRDCVNSNPPTLTDYGDMYAVSPSLEAPYTVRGELSEYAEDYAITMLNNIRFIAGLDPVTLDKDMQDLAQTGSDVCYAMGTISHYPKSNGYTAEKLDMDGDLFESGCTAVSQSNLAYRAMWGGQMNYEYTAHCDSIMLGLMADEDQYNIAVVGHRRWMLNPKMGKTGYGQTTSYTGTQYKDFGVLYAFDYSNTSADEYGVVWPAQTMPVEYFGNNVPWSISMGSTVNADSVNVTLTRLSDNAVWHFNTSSADGFFNVDNGGYGQRGCIIFRPDGIEYGVGDSFRVDIGGLDTEVSYQVDFMSLYYASAEEAGAASHLTFTIDPETNTATLTDCDDKVENIVIPASYRGFPVTKIDRSLAFCENVKTVVIPDSVTEIGEYAFYQCSGLESVTFGSGVETVAKSAFARCAALKSVTFGSNVKQIGDYAFNYCTSLESVSFAGVETVGYSAFSGCTALKTVALTNSVSLIDRFAFNNCQGVTDVYFTGTQEEWDATDIRYGNDDLLNADIRFALSEPDPAAQLSSDGSALRLFAAIDSLEYKKVGFELTVTDSQNGTGSSVSADKTVYSLIALDGYVLTSESFGVENGYVYMLTVNGVPSDFTVTVRPFAICADGEVRYASEKEYSVSDGKIS